MRESEGPDNGSGMATAIAVLEPAVVGTIPGIDAIPTYR
jgi:hypothetical protein